MFDHTANLDSDMRAEEQILAFAEKIFRRSDGVDEVVPPEHVPDWKDAPTRFRQYQNTPQIALPGPLDLQQRYQAARQQHGSTAPRLSDLALMLYLMQSPLKRKVDMNWNAEQPMTGFLDQEYGRGSASGGGLYPAQLYLLAADGQELGAGVYHYASMQHALTPIRFGNWSTPLQQALCATTAHDAAAIHYPYYLVLAIDFWANCFKYHNFGLHVCSQDSGVMLGSVRLLCEALGLPQQSFVCFDNQLANQVIGADGVAESVFAVIGLGQPAASHARHAQSFATEQATPAGQRAQQQPALPTVPQAWQRSKQVNIPASLSATYRLTWQTRQQVQACTAHLPLPAASVPAEVDAQAAARQSANSAQGALAQTICQSLPAILQRRRSAWGSLHGRHAIAQPDLCELLDFVWQRAGSSSGLLREQIVPDSLGLALYANTVTDLAPGHYAWDGAQRQLQLLGSPELKVWQSTYAMNNYNIDEAACIVFITGNLAAIVQQYGARAYLLLNAFVGALTQMLYVGATALHLDCGAVLGVRAQHVKQTLQLDAAQNVCIAVYLSQAQTPIHLFDFSLTPDVPTWKAAP